MAGYNYNQNIIGLKEKIKKEIDLSIKDLSASKITFTDPDFTATNTKDAIKELDLSIKDLSSSQVSFTAPDFVATNTKDAIIEAKASGGSGLKIKEAGIIENCYIGGAAQPYQGSITFTEELEDTNYIVLLTVQKNNVYDGNMMPYVVQKSTTGCSVGVDIAGASSKTCNLMWELIEL